MPDLERTFRDLELHLADSDQGKAIVMARHAGTDSARREVAYLALAVAVVVVLIRVIL
jgi:hypothetical protein